MYTYVRHLLFVTIAVGLYAGVASTKTPHYFPDDPIAREPDTQDASKAERYEIGSLYEMTHNLFVTPGYQPTHVRAQNVNTIDEVPDSSWFTNRNGTRPVTAEEL